MMKQNIKKQRKKAGKVPHEKFMSIK